MLGTLENYLALAVAILANCDSEVAFHMLEYGPAGKHLKREDIRETDIMEMSKLKKAGYTYRQIGAMYGLTHGAVYNRIRRFEGRI